jgi:uncharacterized protein YbjQ (UPF0145 family)
VTVRDEVRAAMTTLAVEGGASGTPVGGGDNGRPSVHRSPGRGTTSDLSIDETLLLHSAGWEPVDLVFGVSWWSIPWGVWQWKTGEVEEASSAFAGAFEQAATLLRSECEKVGGSGVIGVEVDVRVSSHHVAITLTGTAVRRTGSTHRRFEFVSDLSARDFVLLTRAGWWPLGLAAGASFVIAPRRTARQWASQQGQNLELPNLTQALYFARERAMERMQAAGLALKAEGVVAVKLREGRSGSNVRVMQFVAIGTGVHLPDGSHRSVAPVMVVPLDEQVRHFEVHSLRAPRRG